MPSPTRQGIRYLILAAVGGVVADVDVYWPYQLAMHEAGHALGTSRFFLPEFPFSGLLYKRAHPTIADSIMNYDDMVDDIDNEPDCSPHPFDALAMCALYQTLD